MSLFDTFQTAFRKNGPISVAGEILALDGDDIYHCSHLEETENQCVLDHLHSGFPIGLERLSMTLEKFDLELSKLDPPPRDADPLTRAKLLSKQKFVTMGWKGVPKRYVFFNPHDRLFYPSEVGGASSSAVAAFLRAFPDATCLLAVILELSGPRYRRPFVERR